VSDALRPLSRPRLYEQLVARLREHIEQAGLGAGDRLPPERRLAEQLGVSRASIKQAIIVLQVQGLLEVRHGGGTYLLRTDLTSEPVEQLVERKRRLPDVLDAREALETKLAELAATRRAAEDLDEIEAGLATMREALEAGELGVEGDRRFHAAVVTAAHSPLLAAFMREIDPQIAESRGESLRQPGRPGRSLAQHERIAEAIRNGEPGAARTAMRRHLRTVSRVKLLRWSPDGEENA
jgi:GntR family transcriptional repressor for pyruvate dehydrogenase complex